MAERKWRVRLGSAAELDLADIARWTTENFGQQQARTYRDAFLQAMFELADGPEIPGSKVRDDIATGLRTVHIARHGRRGRHFILYRAGKGRMIEIVRILHERMDLRRHLPSSNEDRE